MNEEELDDILGAPRAQYQINRDRQKGIRSQALDPNKFQQQIDSIKKVVDPEDPTFVSELLMDMKTGFDTAKKVPGGPVPKVAGAVGAVALRRMGGK